MSSIPLPALAVRPPEQTDVLGQTQKLLALKSLMQGQQLQQGQLQIQQQQIKDQQATTAAAKNWDGQDYDALSKGVLQNGGSANAAFAIQQHGLGIKKTVSDIAATDATTGSKNLETFIGKHKAIGDALEGIEKVPDEQLHDAAIGKVNDLVKGGILDQQHGQQLLQGIQSTQDPKALRDQIDLVAKSSMGAKAVAEQQKTAAETAKDTAQGRLAGVEATEKEKQGAFYEKMGLPPGITPDFAGYAAYIQKGGKPEGYPAFKAAQEAAATQPYKIQTAEAEAKATQLIKGMAEPGYAFNPKTGETVLTDKTSYLQSGGQLQAFRTVGEKDVREDTMLNNRLADVHQKIAEYEQALQKPLKPFDQSRIASVIGGDKLKIGAFGTEIPTDKANAFLKQINLEGLSPEARDQVVAYYNAREAMMGYKTVLSGSARGSDKSMDLLTQALPDPSITDRDYSKRSLDAFKQNLHIVGQGLPTLPGIKSPKEVEAEVWGNKSAGGNTSATKTPGPGNAQYHYQGKKGEIFSNDGQTWYDATGKQVGK